MLTFRLVLENLLQETRANLEDIGFNMSTTQYACPDEVERGSVESDRRLLIAQADRGVRLISEIKHALDLIDSGEYGICESCADDIDPRRLKVYPTARYCTQCQELMERGVLNHGQVPVSDHT